MKEPMDIEPAAKMARPVDQIVAAAARLSDAIAKVDYWDEWLERRQEIVELNAALRVRLLNAIAMYEEG